MKRILIIDDDKNICHILSKLLEKEGFHTDSVYKGEDALKLLLKKHYDFMIVDYNLPDTNGLEIIKKLSHTKPIMGKIMISAYGDKLIKSKVIQENALFFDKPFNNQILIKTIKAYINQHQLNQQNNVH